MKNFIAAIFTTVLANSAYAATLAPVQVGSCTRDFNAWGQSSSCVCPETSRYEKAVGQCVVGEPVSITTDGVIGSELSFDGDAVSFVFSSETMDSYELVLTRQLRAEMEELEAQKLNFRVRGEVLDLGDEEDKSARPLLIVRDLEILATFR